MLNCYTAPSKKAVPITCIQTDQFKRWLADQNIFVKNWLQSCAFTARPESICLIPAENGLLKEVLVGINHENDFWNVGHLSTALPLGIYEFALDSDSQHWQRMAMSWGLGAYQFSRYRKPTKTISKLVLPKSKAAKKVERIVESVFHVRDLINTPTEDMGPAELGEFAVKIGKTFNANVKQIIGDDLLKRNYPAVHAVGRASTRPPRVIDLRWGNPKHPKVTLAGKGVCFDSGGLDLKTASGMQFMKKDMGGAAHALGLAYLIMAEKLPVRLRVLIPAVENVIAGNAYRPGDVISTRKGLSVEIGNTDAEGRVVLGDVLAEASTESPELLIDFATLTGAARVAVGVDIAALFTPDDELAEALSQYANQEQDAIWRLPLYSPYRKLLDSPVADINNNQGSGYAGAITAALFLKEFVSPDISWAHFDFMAWNLSSRSGRPEGGEANTLRAVFAYLSARYNEKH